VPNLWGPVAKCTSFARLQRISRIHTVATYFEVLQKDSKQQPQAASHALSESERAAWLSEHNINVKMPDHHELLGCIFSHLPSEGLQIL
jgi:hypothetical protein